MNALEYDVDPPRERRRGKLINVTLPGPDTAELEEYARERGEGLAPTVRAIVQGYLAVRRRRGSGK
jgi:hypothetical protein